MSKTSPGISHIPFDLGSIGEARQRTFQQLRSAEQQQAVVWPAGAEEGQERPKEDKGSPPAVVR